MKFSVVYTIDQAYQVPFCTSLTSLLIHNKDLVDQVFVIHNKESIHSKEFQQTISFVNSKYGLRIISIEIDDAQFKNLRADQHVSHATYYRLCLADFLPDYVQSVLLLDPDTIITKELTLFSEIGFVESPELMCYAVDHGFSNLDRLKPLCPELEAYFNAGVLFLNMELMRKELDSKSLIKYGVMYKEKLLFWDQDILNIFFNKKWEAIPTSYNALGVKERLQDTPELIHFAGNRKPWNYFCDHPYRILFWKVLKQTPFAKNYKMKMLLGDIITSVLLPIARFRDNLNKVLDKAAVL